MFKQFLEMDSRKNWELKNIYQMIHELGPISKIDLLEKTKLKKTTLTRMMDELLSRKLIRECGFAESSGGRPPILYEVEEGGYYIIGVDVSRIETRVVLVDLLFRQLVKESFVMTSEHTPERTVLELKRVIDGLMETYSVGMNQLLGIGIGAVGPLDSHNGMILQPEAFYAPGWENVPLVDMIQEFFPVKVLLRNGAQTSLFGEYHQDPIMGRNILYCISGEGLRCGVMSNGQLVQNKTGDASAFGHMIIEVNGRPCSCGKKGCLISYISYQAIRQEINLQLEPKSISPQQTINMIKQRDPLAKQAIMNSAYYYGIGIANMVNLLHPEVVVLSGHLIYDYPGYFDEVVKTAMKNVYYSEREYVRFTQGVLKSDAAAVGAAILIFQSYFKDQRSDQ